MNDVEMRFALVRDALNRGYSAEEAATEAGKLAAFALTGDLPQSRGPIVGWRAAGGDLTLYFADGSRTTVTREYELGRDLNEARS
jgi:hypothetical protein